MTPAGMLDLMQKLMGWNETCPTCGHVVEHPPLLTDEDCERYLKAYADHFSDLVDGNIIEQLTKMREKPTERTKSKK